jgi:DNA-binding protein YbaB
VNSEEKLYNLAKEIDARVTAVEQAAKTGESLPLVLNIGASLGTVTVDGSGGLVSVDLARDAIAGQTGASLAGHVLRAITNAESAASTRRRTMIDDAAREVR